MNSIHSLTLYRITPDVWAFDDEARGIIREPFVGDTNKIIDFIFGKTESTTILFSDQRFPGSFKAEKCDVEYGGTWYRITSNGKEIKGWLCPTLFAYYEIAPEHLYLKAA